MYAVDLEALPWQDASVNTRSMPLHRKVVREGELLPGVGYTSRSLKFGAGADAFTTPRHHHEFAQVRYTLRGSQDFGRGFVLPQGWVSFFPTGAYYGPQRVDSAESFQIQWSPVWVTHQQTMDAIASLQAQGGRFEKGIFSIEDEGGHTKRKDAVNAVWEAVYGRELVIPEPQYSTPIMINPAAFKWRPYLDGLSVKTLGHFSDEDLALSAIRWDSRRSLELPLGRTQVLLCTEGSFSVNGTSYPKHSLVWSDWDESVDVTAPEGSEVLRFEFAELDS
jgi:hypothetical protein